MLLTEVLQHAVSLQLSVSDLVLQQDELLLVLQLQHQQPPLAVLQLVYQLLFDLDLTGQVGQVCLEVRCRMGAKVKNTVDILMSCGLFFIGKNVKNCPPHTEKSVFLLLLTPGPKVSCVSLNRFKRSRDRKR